MGVLWRVQQNRTGGMVKPSWSSLSSMLGQVYYVHSFKFPSTIVARCCQWSLNRSTLSRKRLLRDWRNSSSKAQNWCSIQHAQCSSPWTLATLVARSFLIISRYSTLFLTHSSLSNVYMFYCVVVPGVVPYCGNDGTRLRSYCWNISLLHGFRWRKKVRSSCNHSGLNRLWLQD